MENWFVPITFLPAIGLLIMSTSNLVVSLNEELHFLRDKKMQDPNVKKKINQLGKLTRAMVSMYISASLFTLAGIVLAIEFFADYLNESIGVWLSCAGAFFLLAAMIILIFFSINAVKIRREQHMAHNKD